MIVMPIRLLIVCIGLGTVFGLLIKGCSEYNISNRSGNIPTEIEISSIESGKNIADIYLKLNAHWRIFPSSIYEYRVNGSTKPKPKANSTLNYLYYPIISQEHPYISSLRLLSQKYGDIRKIPNDKIPQIKDFRVIVKTRKYEFIDEIPNKWLQSQGIEGIVIGTAQSELNNSEKQFLYKMYPSVNLYNTLVLEENRKPMAKVYSVSMLISGILLGLYMSYLLFKKMKTHLPGKTAI